MMKNLYNLLEDQNMQIIIGEFLKIKMDILSLNVKILLNYPNLLYYIIVHL